MARTGRPARIISNPDLEQRIAQNRRKVAAGERALEERRQLILEAVNGDWPQRRIAEAFGISPGTVSNLIASQRAR